MNQTEQITQATSVTGSIIDAAIQDERMVELERRIEQLETCAAINAETIGRVAEQDKRIERLGITAGKAIVALANSGIELDKRITALEEQAARDRTQVVADAAAIHVVGSAIYDLQQEVMEQGERIEKPEAALAKVMYVLLNGEVGLIPFPGASHHHSILSTEAMRAITEAQRQLGI